MHHDQLKRLVSKALSEGAKRVSAMRTEWDVAGNCTAPVQRELHVRPAEEKTEAEKFLAKVQKHLPGARIAAVNGVPPDIDGRPTRPKNIRVDRDTAMPLTLAMSVRCRKCDNCRALRRMTWVLRAKAETGAARRTWFGTLTLRPEAHVAVTSKARVNLAKQGVDFDALPFGEQFTERHKYASREVTLYLKRVRKQSGAFLRVLCVAEHHKSGLPHYHLLVHEFDALGVKHSVLSKQWLAGFEKWRLVTSLSEATYLCKYLSKSTVARVRASRDYGSPPPCVLADEHRREIKNDEKADLRLLLSRGEQHGLSRDVSTS